VISPDRPNGLPSFDDIETAPPREKQAPPKPPKDSRAHHASLESAEPAGNDEELDAEEDDDDMFDAER
jgi:hypothetical protein